MQKAHHALLVVEGPEISLLARGLVMLKATGISSFLLTFQGFASVVNALGVTCASESERAVCILTADALFPHPHPDGVTFREFARDA